MRGSKKRVKKLPKRSDKKFTGKRAHPQTIVFLKVAYTNIYDAVDTKDNAISYEVVVRESRTSTCGSPKKDKPSWRAAVSPEYPGIDKFFLLLGLQMRSPTQKHLPTPSLEERHPLIWQAVPHHQSKIAAASAARCF